MKKILEYKDAITNIAGLIFFIFTPVLAFTAVLPVWLVGVCTFLSAASGGVIGFLTGKKPETFKPE